MAVHGKGVTHDMELDCMLEVASFGRKPYCGPGIALNFAAVALTQIVAPRTPTVLVSVAMIRVGCALCGYCFAGSEMGLKL